MIAFARTHAVALWTEFTVVVFFFMALPVASYFGLVTSEESWGWLMFYGSLPWSIAATAVPNFVGATLVAVGLGINSVAATTVVCYAISWWLKTLRFDNDG